MTLAVVLGCAPSCIGRGRKNEAARILSALVSPSEICVSALANASFIGRSSFTIGTASPPSVTTFAYIWSHHTLMVCSVKKARPFFRGMSARAGRSRCARAARSGLALQRCVHRV
jgi:hypothetical protein